MRFFFFLSRLRIQERIVLYLRETNPGYDRLPNVQQITSLSLFFGTSLRTGRVHSVTGRSVFHKTIYRANAWIWPNGRGGGTGSLSRRPSLGVATDIDKPNTKPFCWYTFITLRCTVVHKNVARSLRATHAHHVPCRITSRTKDR